MSPRLCAALLALSAASASCLGEGDFFGSDDEEVDEGERADAEFVPFPGTDAGPGTRDVDTFDDTGGPAIFPDAEGEPIDAEVPTLPVPNEGWIGGACASRADCEFDGALCLSPERGFPGGSCSQSCERLCPDRDGANSVTFCARVDGDSLCMPRCDYTLFTQTGCRDEYECRVVPRASDPSVTVATCVPPDLGPGPVTGCLATLTESGIPWGEWNHRPEHPNGVPSLTCTVDSPVLAGPTIRGVTYKQSGRSPEPLKASCDLASALYRFGEVLAEFDLVEVIHIGTYNCRRIGGSSKLSEHGLGRAIDVYGFLDSRGDDYILVKHWQHGTTNPSTRKARVLYQLAQRLKEERIFRTILTPNYNSAHDDHFHLDTKPRSGVFYRLTDPRAHAPSVIDPLGVDDPCGAP